MYTVEIAGRSKMSNKLIPKYKDNLVSKIFELISIICLTLKELFWLRKSNRMGYREPVREIEKKPQANICI